MIETYKLFSGKYDSQVALKLPHHYIYQMIITREGIAVKLVKRCHYDLRKYFFSNCITNIWNSLSDSVVMADNVNQFKHRLDKY